MALQHKTLGKTYLRYLFAGLGSAVIVSIYSIVDAIMVGKYEGSSGTAALSIVMPIWTIILSLGLLFGVGGGSLMSKARGEGDENGAGKFLLWLLSVPWSWLYSFGDFFSPLKIPSCGCSERTILFCRWQKNISNG